MVPAYARIHVSRWALLVQLVYCQIVPMSSREIIARLRVEGWVVIRSRGSHCQLAHPDRPGIVTVPHPRKDFPLGTLKSIEKQSRVKLRE